MVNVSIEYRLRRPTRLHRNRIRHTQLGGYLSDSPAPVSSVEPQPGSTDRTQRVCGVVGLDWADGLERKIQRHPATHPYFEYTFIKAYKPCAKKNYYVSMDTDVRTTLDCTKTSDVIQKNSPGRNSTRELGEYFFGSPEWIHYLSPSTARREIVAWCVFDCVDGSERVIQRYAAPRPYFEDTVIKSWESCAQKNCR